MVRSPRVALALQLAGAALLGMSLQLRWLERGPASSMPARRVADTLLAGHADSIIPRWVGLGWYGLALLSGVTLLLTGLHSRRALVARVGVAIAAALLTGAILAGLQAGPARWSWGALAAVGGATIAVAGAAHPLVVERTARPDRRRSAPRSRRGQPSSG